MAKDDEDFMEFATARGGPLFRTAWLLCGDWHLAEDLVQTALGKLYRSWRRARRADNLDAYARTVLVRTHISYGRRRSNGERPYAALPDQVAEQGDQALRVALLQGLAELPVKDRTVLVLRYWEDLSVEETAQQMGVSAGAVRTRSQRALHKLRTVLGDEARALAMP
ncbi:RNA polymerase subunit sigma-24 [Wenjunlia vitaminophila]|uniref:RNA polymerase subunit sigma-24 n=1 Tax=Wenjunlia vitaminophila TaxID=76728 RepID=A0A0T6LQJ6_WENVI|nr:SigE family RNA polymerase sigma factor [Wenjunlia vitaminophila]KRV48146.1 RNA polymerase subunit sigma-24 [Wenjunlia vitaminophila]